MGEKSCGIQGSPCASPGACPGAVGLLGSDRGQCSITGTAWREPHAGRDKRHRSSPQQGFKGPNLLSQAAAASEAVSEAYKHVSTIGQVISIEQWIWFCRDVEHNRFNNNWKALAV